MLLIADFLKAIDCCVYERLLDSLVWMIHKQQWNLFISRPGLVYSLHGVCHVKVLLRQSILIFVMTNSVTIIMKLCN